MNLLDSPADIADFRRRLLEWYRRHRRPLSWRRSRDPYHIWLAEIMLQQTRVVQMADHYERFLERFPRLTDLAAAEEQEVLKAWEGLGYYSRARNLHRAARRMVAEHGGQVPSSYDELLDLPGVGAYTAAAVSSIAFDADHPVLDGNVTRVLCRVLRIEADATRSAVRTDLIEAAGRLLPPGEAGDFNQAMMELGARLCTPRGPDCGGCPLRDCCRARLEIADPAVLPVRRPRRDTPHYPVAAGLIRGGNRLLVARRPPGGMLGGLWEFPGGKQEPGETLAECLVREVREELGVDIEVGERLASIDHAYSHFSITLHAFAARYLRGEPQALECDAWRWIRPAELDDLPLPRTDRRIVELLRRPGTYLESMERSGATGEES